MSITIQLLGRPRITWGSAAGYKVRSRKSWALLAYLILSERPAARSQLASLLFAEADDPVRALRWCLAEIRRALGDEGSVDGDPVVLRLPPGAVVDVQVVMKGTWTTAVGLPGLGADLLDGMTVKGGAAAELLQQAFARACQLGDPCWEAIAARGLALVAEAAGDTERASSPRPGPA
ncbi:MAG: AfsR/SARP family transcriptional regulator, partial [Streptosporangiaceae bacterium]